MNDSHAQAPYRPPTVTFHGRLEDLTGSTSLLVGARVVRFAAAFATSLQGALPTAAEGQAGVGPGGGGAGGGNLPQGAGGATGGGSGGGGGGNLPFTGLAVVAVSGAGAALASAGALLRRVARRNAAGDA